MLIINLPSENEASLVDQMSDDEIEQQARSEIAFSFLIEPLSGEAEAFLTRSC